MMPNNSVCGHYDADARLASASVSGRTIFRTAHRDFLRYCILVMMWVAMEQRAACLVVRTGDQHNSFANGREIALRRYVTAISDNSGPQGRPRAAENKIT
jgi:hypothetical protein